jgi:ferredoxin
MAYKILGSTCTGCSACEPVCPNAAIREKSGVFIIDPKLCTECEGHFDSPQCVAVCPVDGCIVRA